ncbi:RagB/SusD family nutrient uptake outer membrane protein [Dyadobacter bucti]|uniref:RagB/SusD family nutrient uptake outer membrane protein n=1 Tax=Dyadobacter bucti TaxID=2572203 RepID=UPI003F72707D
MKKSFINCTGTSALAFLIVLMSCNESHLEKNAVGSLNESVLANRAGVNGLLIGAYSLLDGVGASGTGSPWQSPVSNYLLGGIASDDSHKGTEYGDESYMEQIENYTHTPITSSFDSKWRALYAGVQRANDVLRILERVKPEDISEAEREQIVAEAVFLRAVYHFEAAKVWRNVPYVDEKVTFASNNYLVPNTVPIWPMIEKDLLQAIASLTPTKAEVGRANSWAAKAMLAKVYMFQHKYQDAQQLLTDIIANGNTAAGQKYALMQRFSDNFNPSTKNGPESVFAVQMSVNDNAPNGLNGNAGDLLNFPNGGPANCCVFYQPSFSLVNSYKTDPESGLPPLDTWNNGDIKNDQGIASTDPFTPYDGSLDPRLDYTVGRRGIPYLDWGNMPGAIWIQMQSASGPYISIKNSYYKADKATTYQSYGGWATTTANNYNMIRFADVLLWAAEVEVEIGSLEKAETLVNMIRTRAANKDGWVKKYVDNDPAKGYTNIPAANYKIGLYKGQFAVGGKDYARKAVRFERKIELAMEGHRFFDLQRYDNGTGYMADVLNAYIIHETTIPGYDFQYMKGATFKKGKNEIFPIPQTQIDLSTVDGASVLVQNPNY